MTTREGPSQPTAEGTDGRLVHRLEAPILESARLPAGYHRLVVRAPAIGAVAQPGQFLHVWCHDPTTIGTPPAAAVLRRPYSISRVWSGEAVEILLQVRGVGGRMLSGRRVGESLDLIGPLGKGFRIHDDLRTAVVVAGGSGIAPVPFLTETLVARGVRVVALVGAADDDRMPFPVDRAEPGRATLLPLEAVGAEVTFVAEAVEGKLVSEALEERLEELSGPGAEVMATGPVAMLRQVVKTAGESLPVQVSLEERMACGVGACRSCVVPVTGAEGIVYRTVCRDGPVFAGGEIAWERLGR